MIKVVTLDGYVHYINPKQILYVYNTNNDRACIMLTNYSLLYTTKHTARELANVIEANLHELNNQKEWFK